MSDPRCFKFDVNDLDIEDLCFNSIGFDDAITAAILAHNLFWEWMNKEYNDSLLKTHDLTLGEGKRYGHSKRAEYLAFIMRQYRKYMNQIVKETDLEGNIWERPREK